MTKKENPQDLDFVTFLDGVIFVKRQKTLEQFWSFANEDKQLDAYILREYPDSAEEYPEFLLQKNIWQKRFTHTRLENSQTLLEKGFVQIIFEK